MVVAGLVTGNAGKKHAMSDRTRDYLSKFWELVDEILNAILFLLIGLEMLIVKIDYHILLIGILMIGIVLLARWISVFLPVTMLRRWVHFENVLSLSSPGEDCGEAYQSHLLCLCRQLSIATNS